MPKLKERLTAPIKSIYLYAVLLAILLSVYIFADIDKYVLPIFAAKQSTPQSTLPQPILADLSRPTSTDTSNTASAVSTTGIIGAASTSIVEKTMTRDEVCEFLMETDGDSESERITPDKIEEAKSIIPSLIDYMQNGEDGFCASLTMDVLGRAKDKRAFEPILAELYKVQGSQRISPIQALGNLGDPRALAPLISELQRDRTPHDQIGYVVAGALGRIRDARAVDTLIKLLQNDKDTSARYKAATSLGNIKDKRAVDPLIAALNSDSDKLVRQHAADALAMIQDERAVDGLIKALPNEQEMYTQYHIIRALRDQRTPRAVDTLLAAFYTSKDQNVRGELFVNLTSINEPRIVELLLRTLADDANPLRYAALRAFLKIKEPRAVNSIGRILNNDKDESARCNAAQALGYIQDKNAAPFLITAIQKDASLPVRLYSLQALGQIKDRGSVPFLLSVLQNDPEWNMRRRAAEALGEIKDYRAIEPLILNIGRDSSYYTDINAAAPNALEKITGYNAGNNVNQWKNWWNLNKDKFRQ